MEPGSPVPQQAGAKWRLTPAGRACAPGGHRDWAGAGER